MDNQSNNITKNTIRIVVVAIIVFVIFYFQGQKPVKLSGDAPDVVVNYSRNFDDLSDVQTDDDQKLSEQSQSATSTKSVPVDRSAAIVAKSKQYSKAKEFLIPTGFINSPPFSLSDVVGKKVVLIDFWTYSCINCIRTIPYLNAWYQKYKDQGLVIIGVHTPEFDFEKDYNNVEKAVRDFGIEYPVVLDSNYGTWTAYNNRYWPAEYLIDIDGFVIHSHFGEGSYDETEKLIQEALAERNEVLGLNAAISKDMANPFGVILVNQFGVQSPETYFGSDRNQYLANGKSGLAGEQTLTIPSSIRENLLYLDGRWNFASQYAENLGAGKIVYKYDAKNVYFVGSSANGIKIKVTLDGVSLGILAGKDVAPDGTVLIKDNRLYDIINGTDYGEHTLQIEIPDAGLKAFTFTFG